MRLRFFIPALLIAGCVPLACGTSTTPANPDERVARLADEVLQRSFELSFDLAFGMVQAGRSVRIRHAGEFAQVTPDVFHMQAQTRVNFLDEQLAGASTIFEQLHAANGDTLWVETRYGTADPVIIARPWHDAEFDAAVNAADGVQQLSPLDIHPLTILRPCLRLAPWRAAQGEEQDWDPDAEIWIADFIPSELQQAFAHRQQLHQPDFVRLSLDRATGLPQCLQLVDAEQQLRYEVKFLSWTFGALSPGRTDYQPPEDTPVIRQRMSASD